MTFTDEDIIRANLILNDKSEQALDENTLNHLNACLEVMIIENKQPLVDMIFFHAHTLGYVQYVYFIRRFYDKIIQKNNDINPIINSNYIINFEYSLVNKSKIVSRFSNEYGPLLRKARTFVK